MAELYLFDGYNLLYAGPFADARELVDALASYVAVRGARGVVVFDGVGEDVIRGPLEVRFAAHADTLLERLAAEHRDASRVLLVTSDATVASPSPQPADMPRMASSSVRATVVLLTGSSVRYSARMAAMMRTDAANRRAFMSAVSRVW